MRESYDEEKLIVECYRQPIAYHIVVLCTYHESANARIARPWISLCGFQLPAQSGSDGALGFVQNSGYCDCMLVIQQVKSKNKHGLGGACLTLLGLRMYDEYFPAPPGVLLLYRRYNRSEVARC